MAFSDQQLTFALVFLILFVIAISFAYYKDIKQNKWYTKGSWKVLLLVISILTFFYLVVRLLGAS